MIRRRTFIKSVSMVAIGSSGSAISVGVSEAQQVPNSSGTEPSQAQSARGRLRLPPPHL